MFFYSSAKLIFSFKNLALPKFLIVAIFLLSNSAFSQDPIREANLQLRHFFQYTYLASPAPPTDFLYDLSTKLTDSVYYTHLSEDTIHVGSELAPGLYNLTVVAGGESFEEKLIIK